MAKTVDLGSKLIRATQSINRPVGIASSPRVVLGEDATSAPAAWLYFAIDDQKAKPSKLLEFQRLVEQAAAKVEPAVATYIRFAPAVAAAPAPQNARKPALKRTAVKKSPTGKVGRKTLVASK